MLPYNCLGTYAVNRQNRETVMGKNCTCTVAAKGEQQVKPQINEAIALVRSYFYDYLTARDFQKITAYFSKDITWFGTGAGEICHNLTEARQLISDDLQQMPMSLYIDNDWFKAYEVSSNTFIVWGGFSASTHTGLGAEISFEGVRITAICTYAAHNWTMRHFHVSLAAAGQELDEFYPIKEVERQNMRLQELVEEKTVETEEQKRQLEEAYLRIHDINAQLILANRKLGILNEMLKEQASNDILTSTLNHYYIVERLAFEIAQAADIPQPLCIIMLDLDHFKAVNDTFGHVTGDKLLVKIAEIMRTALRKSDAIGRYGGEEFLIVLPNTKLKEAASIAERIRQAIAGHLYTDFRISMTASLGVAQYTPGRTVEHLIDAADNVLYRAKVLGRNQVAAESGFITE